MKKETQLITSTLMRVPFREIPRLMEDGLFSSSNEVVPARLFCDLLVLAAFMTSIK